MKSLKKIAMTLIAAICLVFVACNNNQPEAKAPVTVHVDGFSISQEDFPAASQAPARAAANPADYNDVNAITLAFYKADGTELYKHEQLKSDNTTFTTFGEFECSLPMGTHTMVVLAYFTNENSVLTLTSPTEASFNVRVRETFATTQTVTISNTNAVDISATLSRVVSMLTVKSSDGKTSDVTNVRMTFSAGGKDFNPTTGLAITTTGLTNTVGNSAAVGATSTSSTMLFLNTDEQDIDVTIETLDANGNTLFSKTIENVPFKLNRITKLTGAMYTNTGIAGSFQVNTDWLSEQSVDF